MLNTFEKIKKIYEYISYGKPKVIQFDKIDSLCDLQSHTSLSEENKNKVSLCLDLKAHGNYTTKEFFINDDNLSVVIKKYNFHHKLYEAWIQIDFTKDEIEGSYFIEFIFTRITKEFEDLILHLENKQRKYLEKCKLERLKDSLLTTEENEEVSDDMSYLSLLLQYHD